MGKWAEKLFWRLFEACEAIHAVTGAALTEVEWQAQERIFNGDKSHDDFFRKDEG